MKKFIAALLALTMLLPLTALADADAPAEAAGEQAFLSLRLAVPEDWSAEAYDMSGVAIGIYSNEDQTNMMTAIGINAGSETAADAAIGVYNIMLNDPDMLRELLLSVMGSMMEGVDLSEQVEQIIDNMTYTVERPEFGGKECIRIRLVMEYEGEEGILYLTLCADGPYIYEIETITVPGGDESVVTDILDSLTFGECVALEAMPLDLDLDLSIDAAA